MAELMRRHVHCSNISVTFFAKGSSKNNIGLVAVTFGQNETYNGVKTVLSDNDTLKKYSDLVMEYLNNSIPDLSPIKLSLEGYTDFQRSVLEAARKIPRGHTVSYKDLAEMSGHPNAIRAVATVMRNNPFPLIIPCHRVIRSDGTIGGFAGQHTGKMVKLKRQLLDLEKNNRN